MPRLHALIGMGLLAALAATPALAEPLRTGSLYERSYERQYDYGRRQLEPDFWELRDRFGQAAQDRFGLGYERGGPEDRLYRYQYEQDGRRSDSVEWALRRADMARRGLLDAPVAHREAAPARADSVWRDEAFERFGFAGGDGR